MVHLLDSVLSIFGILLIAWIMWSSYTIIHNKIPIIRSMLKFIDSTLHSKKPLFIEKHFDIYPLCCIIILAIIYKYADEHGLLTTLRSDVLLCMSLLIFICMLIIDTILYRRKTARGIEIDIQGLDEVISGKYVLKKNNTTSTLMQRFHRKRLKMYIPWTRWSFIISIILHFTILQELILASVININNIILLILLYTLMILISSLNAVLIYWLFCKNSITCKFMIFFSELVEPILRKIRSYIQPYFSGADVSPWILLAFIGGAQKIIEFLVI